MLYIHMDLLQSSKCVSKYDLKVNKILDCGNVKKQLRLNF